MRSGTWHAYRSVALAVAWRTTHNALTTPNILIPSIAFPLFFFTAFVGGLSQLSNLPGFEFPAGYTAFQFVFVLLQSAAFGGVFTGFGIARDFEYGFSRRLMLAAPHRSAILVGYGMAAIARWAVTATVLVAVALVLGMDVIGSGVEVVGLFTLALLVNICALGWASGIATRFRSLQAGPLMQMPVFLVLFFAPVYVPLALLVGLDPRRGDASTPSRTCSKPAAASSPVRRSTWPSPSAPRSACSSRSPCGRYSACGGPRRRAVKIVHVRRALTWLLLVPLALLGSEAAHSVDYWLVERDPGQRAALLADTGHGYLDVLPAAIATCWAVVLLALLGWALEGGRGRRAPVLPFAPFALLPPIAFAGRELIERASHGELQLSAVLEPVFLVGLAVQIPFAVVAFLAGRALLHAASALGAKLSRNRERGPLAPRKVPSAGLELSLPRLSPLAFAQAVRGPPAVSRS